VSEPSSFAQAIFQIRRDAFLTLFEEFLASPATPAEARRVEALETEDRLSAIVDRLKAQRVI
jgi:hypothetical protein